MASKGRTLTKIEGKSSPNRLVSKQNLDKRFVVAFKYKLEKGYRLDDLEKRNLRELQKFLDTISNMTVQEVDQKYKRQSDKTDLFQGQPVHHYKVNEKFRVHGIIEGGRFKIIRLDPNHKFHK